MIFGTLLPCYFCIVDHGCLFYTVIFITYKAGSTSEGLLSHGRHPVLLKIIYLGYYWILKIRKFTKIWIYEMDIFQIILKNTGVQLVQKIDQL